MTDGNWRLGVFVDERATDEQADKLVAGLRRAARRSDGRRSRRSSARCSASSGRRSRCSDDGLRHSVRVGDAIDFEIEDIVPFGVETGEPVRFDGMFHPVGVRPDDGRGEALADQRVRHRVRGQDRALDVRVLLGRLSRDRVGARARRAARASRRRSRPRAPGSGSSRCSSRSPRVGWWWTVDRMRGHGRRAVDRRSGRSAGSSASWVVMMAAMMFPSVAPTVALYSRMTEARSPLVAAAVRGRLPRRRGRRPGVARVRRRARPAAGSPGDVLAWDRAGRWVAGATLLVAAAYELTPLKDVCLGKCRSPLGFLLGSWRDGRSGALQMGAEHGAWCVGCCWALMASLFALGVMSIAWMAFVAGADRGREDRSRGDGSRPTGRRRPARARRAAARRARRRPGAHDPGARRDAGHTADGHVALRSAG